MGLSSLPPRAVEIVESGLLVTGSRLADAEVIVIPSTKRSSTGWPTIFLAARIVGGEFDGSQVGVWALDIDATGTACGPCFALDSTAREWSSWGESVPAGSRMMEHVERLAGYDEARVVRAAVGAR